MNERTKILEDAAYHGERFLERARLELTAGKERDVHAADKRSDGAEPELVNVFRRLGWNASKK